MKLILLNGLIIAVVIWFAGVSVKDFACLVVGQFELVGEGNSHFFNRTMDIYFWRASILAVLVAILIHYVFTHNVLSPLKQLTKSTQLMIEGKSPELVAVKSDDEIVGLSAILMNWHKHCNEQKKIRNVCLIILLMNCELP